MICVPGVLILLLYVGRCRWVRAAGQEPPLFYGESTARACPVSRTLKSVPGRRYI